MFNAILISGKRFLKFFIIAVIAIIIGVLTLGQSSYNPDGYLNQSIFQYVVVPLIGAILAALEKLKTELSKEKK